MSRNDEVQYPLTAIDAVSPNPKPAARQNPRRVQAPSSHDVHRHSEDHILHELVPLFPSPPNPPSLLCNSFIRDPLLPEEWLGWETNAALADARRRAQSFPCRPHCITVPELRFVLRDLGRVADEAVDVEESVRKWSRERRGWSSEVGDGDDVDVGDVLVLVGERLAGDREREVRMRANRVVSVVGDRESEARGVEGPEHVVFVVEGNIDWKVEDEAEKDRAGAPGFASG
ncbi:hypothetical protein MMC11_008913 [Xylographa trunciseda]|nr:hypothetical protein [Xylographa trunciseda]